jgi:hypothetical protein
MFQSQEKINEINKTNIYKDSVVLMYSNAVSSRSRQRSKGPVCCGAVDYSRLVLPLPLADFSVLLLLPKVIVSIHFPLTKSALCSSFNCHRFPLDPFSPFSRRGLQWKRGFTDKLCRTEFYCKALILAKHF